jgi:hypothetical protein
MVAAAQAKAAREIVDLAVEAIMTAVQPPEHLRPGMPASLQRPEMI